MKTVSFFRLVLFLLAGLPVILQAEFKLSAECTKPAALFKAGEKITFRVKLENEKGTPERGRKISYTLKGDGGLFKRGEILSGGSPAEIVTKLDRPGFVLLTVDVQGQKKKLRTWAGAGVEPEKIRPATPDVSDFDAFWAARLKELRSRKIKAELTPVNDPKIRFGVKVYKVQLDNGALRANGYLLVPDKAKEKTLPLTVMFNGASSIGAAYTGKDNMAARYRTLVFEMNLHDIPVDIPRSEWPKWRQSENIRNYMFRDTADPQKYRIGQIFMRVALSLEYLKTRPEWNRKTIIARGGSLGGAQAMAAAYFAPETALCVANAPALCDHYGADLKQFPGWPDLFNRLKKDPAEAAAARKTMVYFDMVNFARRLKCPVAMSTGFIDTVCPPTTAYAVYNILPGKKSIVNVTLGMHGISLKKGEPSVFACGGDKVSQVCRQVRIDK